MSKGQRAFSVFIDGRMIVPQGHGIANYVIDMIKGIMERNPPYSIHLLVHHPSAVEQVGKNLPIEYVHCESEFLSPKEWLEIPRLLKKRNAGLFHSPSFASWWSLPCPHIVTIHDLNHIHYGNLKQKLYYQILLRRFAHRAKSVLSVSEFSADEIQKGLGLKKRPIVAPNAFQKAEPSDRPLSAWGLEKNRYHLCVSNPKPHKNLKMLKSAYERGLSLSAPLRWPLAMTTDPHFRELSAQDLQTLFRGAAAVYFPSLYEGFGRPVVEGLIAGAPVWASQIAPHGEIAPQKGLRLIDPLDEKAWTAAFAETERGTLERPDAQSIQSLLNRFSVGRLAEVVDREYRLASGEI